jgi:hypothetical protein
MAENLPAARRKGRAQGFRGKASPCPPGTKNKGGHLPPYGEPPIPRRWWFLFAGAVVAALTIGVVVGRFLL